MDLSANHNINGLDLLRSSVPAKFTVGARVSGKRVSVSELRPCLDELQAKRALLRAVPQKVPWNWTMRLVQTAIPVPLEEVQLEDSSSIASLVETELRTPNDFGAGVPGVKCTLVDIGHCDQAILLTVHHALFDGRSAQFLLQDIFKLLGAAGAGLEADDNVTGFFEHQTACSQTDIDSFALHERARQQDIGHMAPLLDASAEASAQRVDFLSFSTAATQRIIAQAKQRGVSVTSLLSAAIAKAVGECHASSSMLNMNLDVDGRRGLSADMQRALGLLNTHINFPPQLMTTAAGDLWAQAQACHQFIQQALERNWQTATWKFLPAPWAIKALSTMAPMALIKHIALTDKTVTLSNLGVVPQQPGFTMVEGFFAGTSVPFGGLYVCNILTVGARLTIGVVSVEPWVSTAQSAAFCSALRAAVDTACVPAGVVLT